MFLSLNITIVVSTLILKLITILVLLYYTFVKYR